MIAVKHYASFLAVVALLSGAAAAWGYKEKTGTAAIEAAARQASEVASTWAQPGWKKAIDEGTVVGYGDGTYGPHDPTSREETVAIAERVATQKTDELRQELAGKPAENAPAGDPSRTPAGDPPGTPTTDRASSPMSQTVNVFGGGGQAGTSEPAPQPAPSAQPAPQAPPAPTQLPPQVPQPQPAQNPPIGGTPETSVSNPPKEGNNMITGLIIAVAILLAAALIALLVGGPGIWRAITGQVVAGAAGLDRRLAPLEAAGAGNQIAGLGNNAMIFAAERVAVTTPGGSFAAVLRPELTTQPERLNLAATLAGQGQQGGGAQNVAPQAPTPAAINAAIDGLRAANLAPIQANINAVTGAMQTTGVNMNTPDQNAVNQLVVALRTTGVVS